MFLQLLLPRSFVLLFHEMTDDENSGDDVYHDDDDGDYGDDDVGDKDGYGR